MKKIWKRYFFTELMKVFVLFICCFYFLFILVDYSIHSKAFQKVHISFGDIFFYYIFQFTKRVDVLIPIALLISTIKVLTLSNLRNEIVALATGGISLKRILHPFFCVAWLCTALLYFNFQFLQPYTLNKINAFEELYFKAEGKKRDKKQVNALVLEDHSLLMFQSYDSEKETFFDVFWLTNSDQLYRIQTLFPYAKIPFGKYVDSLMRTSNGEIVKLDSCEKRVFPDMHFNKEALFNAVYPPRMQSISQLASYLVSRDFCFSLNRMSDKEAEAATTLYFKLTVPLICLLAVLGPAPFCLRFGRNLPVFLIYALGICGVVILFACLNAFVILGESQVIPPLCAILFPQMVFFLILGYKYAKL